MLAVVKKGKTGVGGDFARASAGFAACFKQGNFGMRRQRGGGGQTRPTGTDYRHFAPAAHGLNPNSQYFSASLILRGLGMRILYFSTFSTPSRMLSCNRA